MNKVVLVGNLGRDAELRYTAGGSAVATLNMATTDKWTDKDGKLQEKTEWHRIVLWGKTAESLATYLTKGKQVYVEGRIQSHDYEDKDGTKKHAVEIRADRVVLLGGGQGRATDDGTAPAGSARRGSAAHAAIADDDVPF